MSSLKKSILALSCVALVVPLALPVAAQAADSLKPSKSVCSILDDKSEYACMDVNAKKVPFGDTATFTGTLSASARKSLNSWPNGDNIVCLTRYKTTKEADGSWPWDTLDAACTTVRKNGGFTINAEFGRKGTFYYGLEMGPCRSKDKEECGSSDPSLIALGGTKGNKVLQLRTS